MALSIVLQHIIDSVRAAVAESDGKEAEATRLRAQCKLRLVCMSDEELWELADITCRTPGKTIEQSYQDLRETIKHYKETSDEWLLELTQIVFTDPPN